MTKIIDRLKLSVAAGILGDIPRHPLYVMEDRFGAPVASGILNGTAATPGPSATRTVTDTSTPAILANAGVTNYYDNICFDGSSLTQGFGLANPTYENYAAQVMALLPNVQASSWFNNGLAGQNTLQMNLRASIGLLPELSSGNLVAATVYKIKSCQTDYFFPGCVVGEVFAASSTIALDANNKVQEIRWHDTEKNSGNLTIGNWYRVSATVGSHFHYSGGWAALGDVFQATATDSCSATEKVRPMTTATSSIADLRVSPLFGSNIMVAWELGNDIVTNGADAATAVANFVTYCNNRKAAGWNKIIALTITPRTTAGFNAVRNAANQLMRDYVSPPWDALVDVGADATIGPDAAASGPYYQDGIHLTMAGYAIVAALVAPVLNAMLTGFHGGAILKGKSAWGDPGLWYASQARTAGRGFAFTVSKPRFQANGVGMFGWGAAQNNFPTSHVIYLYGGPELALSNNAVTVRNVGTISADKEYRFAVFPRAAGGAYYFGKGGIYDKWTMLRAMTPGTVAAPYPALTPNTYTMPIKFALVFDAGQLIVPLASDSFAGTRTGLGSTDGLGHASTAGFDDGGSGVAWVAPTWTVSSSYARNSALALGSELNSGTLEIGKWYVITADTGGHFFTGSAALDTFVATAATSLDANNKVKELLLYGGSAFLNLGTSNQLIITTGLPAVHICAGVDLCVDSTSNPQSFLRVYYSRVTGLTYMDKYLNGSWSNVIPGVNAGASPELQIRKQGNSITVHGGGTFVGRYTIDPTVDALIANNTICGMFHAGTASCFDYFVAYGSQATATDKILRSFCG